MSFFSVPVAWRALTVQGLAFPLWARRKDCDSALALDLASLGRQAGRISQSFPLLLSQDPSLEAADLEIQFRGASYIPRRKR